MRQFTCLYKKTNDIHQKFLVDIVGDDEYKVSINNHFAFSTNKTYNESDLLFDNDTVSLKPILYTKKEFNKKLIKIIRDNMDSTIILKGLKEKFSFKNDLGFDSLDMIHLSVDIEREFFVCLEDDELLKIKTIKDLKDYLKFLIKE
jgi:acyl carrier protein